MSESAPDTNKEQQDQATLEGTLDKLGLGILKPALNLFGIGALLQSFGNSIAANPIFSWLGSVMGSQAPAEQKERPTSSAAMLQEATDVIKKFEGFHTKAYWDYQQYSIGFGTKATSAHETITKEEAAKRLEQKLQQEFLPGVQKIPYWNEMSQKMQVALLSFAYNVGAHFYGSAGTEGLSKLLRNKEWDKVPAQLEKYNKAGGNVLQGLVTRRAQEAALWKEGLEHISS